MLHVLVSLYHASEEQRKALLALHSPDSDLATLWPAFDFNAGLVAFDSKWLGTQPPADQFGNLTLFD